MTQQNRDITAHFKILKWIEQKAADGELDGKSYVDVARMASRDLGFHVGNWSISKIHRETDIEWRHSRGGTGMATRQNYGKRVEQLENVVAYLMNDLYSDRAIPVCVRQWFVAMNERNKRDRGGSGNSGGGDSYA